MKNWLLAHTGRFGRIAMEFGKDRRGVTAIEYSLIASMAVIALLAGGQQLMTSIGSKLSAIATDITGVPGT